MRRDGARQVSRLAMLLAAFGWVAIGSAAGVPGTTRIPGGGKSKSDCYAEYDLVGVTGTSSKITCTDGDPCDADGQCDGTCTFSTRLCVNQTDIEGCTSTALKRAPKVTKKLLSVPSFTGATCGLGDIPVRLKGKKKNKKATRTVVVTAVSTSKPATDKDTLKFTCKPRVGGCPTTTTTTLPPAPAGTLSFSPTIRTTTCGGPASTGFTTPGAPLSGEVDGAGAMKLPGGDLGLGCLYVGGGTAAVAASLIPDGTTTYLTVTPAGGSMVTLGPSAGTGPENCSQGAGPGKHCIAETNNGAACTSDAECGGNSGSCALDANCFFGPPLPIANEEAAALSTCVLNVIAMDASGTADSVTGESTSILPLSSRVYLTGNATAPCPVCVDTFCSGDNATRCFADADCATAGGTCSVHFGEQSCLGGADDGKACTPIGTLKTSFQCRPQPIGFQAPLPVTLNPLKSDAAGVSLSATRQCVLGPTPGNPCSVDADCGSGGTCQNIFCPGQPHGGAFHFTDAVTVKENGLPAGNMTDMQPHHSILASVFCIPGTGNVGIDTVASLPGPGAIAIDGMAQIH